MDHQYEKTTGGTKASNLQIGVKTPWILTKVGNYNIQYEIHSNNEDAINKSSNLNTDFLLKIFDIFVPIHAHSCINRLLPGSGSKILFIILIFGKNKLSDFRITEF